MQKTIHEKEQSYEDSSQMRRTVSILRNENLKLKTRVIQGEHELIQKNKEIKKLIQQINTPLYNTSKTLKKPGLVQGLKKRIIAMQKENRTLKEGLTSLKKSLKMTATQELNAEIKVYSDECTRLRSMIENNLQGKDYSPSEDTEKVGKKIKEQNGFIEKLKNENKELNKQLENAAKEIEKWKNKSQEKNKSETTNSNLNKEIKKLKDQIETMKKSDRSKELEEELKKVKANSVQQEKKYEERIKELETKLSELKKSKVGLKEFENEEKKTVIVKLIDEDNAKKIATTLKLNLIISNMDIKNGLFKNNSGDHKISIKELCVIFEKNPSSLKSEDAFKLARYLIESRIGTEVNYNELADKKISNVIDTIKKLTGDFSLEYNKEPEELQISLLNKLGDKIEKFAELIQNTTDDNEIIMLKDLEKICQNMKLELSQDEFDYLVLAMYKFSKDINKLNCTTLVEHLEELLNKYLDENSVSEQAKSEIKKDMTDSEKGSSKKSPDDKFDSDKKSSEKKPEEEDEIENLSEEEILGLVQKCFTEIAEKMAAKGLTPESLFKEGVYTKEIDGEKIKLIPPKEFTKAIRKIGVREFKPLEQAYLDKMLAANESEEGFRLNDLLQILKDYENDEGGNHPDNNSEKDEESKDLNIDELDKISMVLLLALSEYSTNSKNTLEELFENVLYKQPVQIDDEELEIDILNSSGFFKTINDLGIETEENQHDNLKNFLCIDQSYPDKFSLDKLKMAIEEFKTNDKLRERVNQYYREFVDEGQVQDDNEE